MSHRSFKLLAAVFAILAGLACSNLSWAGGSQTYGNGSEGFSVANWPPPNLYFINYANYYTADDYKDNSGSDNDTGPEVDTFSNTFRLLWISDYKIFGGTYGAHIFVPIVHKDLEFSGAQDSSSDDKAGLGNIIFTPFMVNWTWDDFHLFINIADVFAPTQTDYDNEDSVNTGNDFWTIEPLFAFTWLPGDFEFSAKVMYDISTKDNDHIVSADEAAQLGRPEWAGLEKTRKPGQEFHFDYVAGYNVTENLIVAAVGYYYQQTTDDEIDGKDVNDRKSKVYAIGPGFKYDYKDVSFIGKVYFEDGAKNKNEGVSSFFKFLYPF